MCTTTVLPHNTTTNSSFVYKFGNKSDCGSDCEYCFGHHSTNVLVVSNNNRCVVTNVT